MLFGAYLGYSNNSFEENVQNSEYVNQSDAKMSSHLYDHQFSPLNSSPKEKSFRENKELMTFQEQEQSYNRLIEENWPQVEYFFTY
jgi:hypothetical protein